MQVQKKLAFQFNVDLSKFLFPYPNNKKFYT